MIQPLFGYIGDKIGHKHAVTLFSVLAFVGIYPLFNLLKHHAHQPGVIFMGVVGLFVILSFYTSVAGIFKAKLFPEHVRALGTGFSFAIGNAIFGGTAPYVALKFKSAHIENGFFVYVAVIMAAMFVASLCLPKKTDLD
ncbi:Alpha-ketoglutarate permease [Helicobacter bizzozeronii CCUG 35545]|nr:Alpha-ketoglutarate permease [Helicobacter bizzozeronii CCUG 35545]